MAFNLTEDEFKARNRIDATKWQEADIAWGALEAIGRDVAKKTGEMFENAAFYASRLQRCAQVHSVRWRVKDPEHVLEKIVRKRAEKSDKYADISVDNYRQKITDLIGLRAIHLFKSQWPSIHRYIDVQWQTCETPIAYIRDGDSAEFRKSYEDAGCEVKNHPHGYRSVHYVIETRPQKDPVWAEVQVRTIFEEGWSEIDHQIRYPNFSDNRLVGLFLMNFNRLAGNADEMGEFVRALAAELQRYEDDLASEQGKAAQHIERINALVQSLSAEQEKGAARDKRLFELSKEVSSLRAARSLTHTRPYSSGHGFVASILGREAGSRNPSIEDAIEMMRRSDAVAAKYPIAEALDRIKKGGV